MADEKEEKRGRGRPEWIPNDESIKNVESLASRGLTKEQIADALGISYQTLNEKTKEYSDFSDAIKRGQAKGIAEISNSLFANAKAGNMTAALFYLKCRAGWKETSAIELSGQIDVTKLSDEELLAIAAAKSTGGT